MTSYNVTIELTDMDQLLAQTIKLLRSDDDSYQASNQVSANMIVLRGQGERVAKALGIPVELISIDDIEQLSADAHKALKLDRFHW